MVSMGHQACGALELWNYPIWMRNLVAQDVDLAALEIYRDRERSVARYNDFPRRMLQIPISKWQDLSDNEETLGEVYGDDVQQLHLLVGLKIKEFAHL
uniref:Uncharacterized protein n=1 Tax=Solanum lycopersicum TaxID=4081 RepID=K4BBL7_SOLLC